MKERGVTEEEAEGAIETPDYSEPSIKGRINAFKFIKSRHLRVTYKDEAGRILVITVTIRKKPFKEH
ncbi:MAG TPA: hypothetical protein DCS05_08185 [Nitrospiraceae bacterium]|nr:hypothetical protein [Nitrospiraceae bacterium]